MSKLIDKLNKSDFAKLPNKKDRTPISANDFDHKRLQISAEKLTKGRGGALGNKSGGFAPGKNYSKVTSRR